jgi:hypothetical protein
VGVFALFVGLESSGVAFLLVLLALRQDCLAVWLLLLDVLPRVKLEGVVPPWVTFGTFFEVVTLFASRHLGGGVLVLDLGAWRPMGGVTSLLGWGLTGCAFCTAKLLVKLGVRFQIRLLILPCQKLDVSLPGSLSFSLHQLRRG